MPPLSTVIAKSSTREIWFGSSSAELSEEVFSSVLSQIQQLCANAGVEFMDLDQQPGASFWADPTQVPRNSLESWALQLYRSATDHFPEWMRSDPRSGAEYWVQVKQADGDRDSEIQWHCDKDEELYAREGHCVTPALATVTYLSASGNPTVVVDSRASEDGRLEWRGWKRVRKRVRAVACSPRPGRQLRFDGALLHGVPADLGNGGRGLRITLLVNIWLCHRPAECRESFMSTTTFNAPRISCNALLPGVKVRSHTSVTGPPSHPGAHPGAHAHLGAQAHPHTSFSLGRGLEYSMAIPAGPQVARMLQSDSRQCVRFEASLIHSVSNRAPLAHPHPH
eukprot:TRINITY_DN5702_c0_g1_i2.p1 TRINITY_DN5702_c0_g1~~TRINITY_DN5702_c0_g1_i2.p1  ORF type:complete len:338 (+),score=31.63 TRINITY_DN5702_c0_g1_i2:152-1165(+)